MRIKFIKEYLFNKKDTIINLDDSNAKRLIDAGFAEKTKETQKLTEGKTITNNKPKAKTKKPTIQKAPQKEPLKKVNENKCKGCGDVDEPCEDCKD